MVEAPPAAVCPRWQLACWLSGSLQRVAAEAAASPRALLALAAPLAAVSTGSLEATTVVGQQGVHAAVAKVMSGAMALPPDIDLDTALDEVSAIAAAAASALPPGASFPLPPCTDVGALQPPLLFRFPGWHPSFDAAHSNCSALAAFLYGSDRPPRASTSCVSPRALPPVIVQTVASRQTSQDDVGRVLWPSAPVLSRWLHLHGWLLRGRKRPGRLDTAHVLEIGAGMGLAGIVAALVGNAVLPLNDGDGGDSDFNKSRVSPPGCIVTLSDFEPTVCANLAANVRTNDPGAHHPGFPDFTGRVNQQAGRMVARRLDWFATPAPPSPPLFVTTATSHLPGASGEVEEGGGAAATACNSGVDSAVPPELHPRSGGYDVVLGTDVVCRDEDADAIVSLLTRLLAKPEACGGKGGACSCGVATEVDDDAVICSCVGGVGLLLLPPPSARFGVQRLLRLLDDAAREGSMDVAYAPVPPAFLQVHREEECVSEEQGDGSEDDAPAACGSGCWCASSVLPLRQLPRHLFRDGDDPAAVTAGGHEASNVLIFVKWKGRPDVCF